MIILISFCQHLSLINLRTGNFFSAASNVDSNLEHPYPASKNLNHVLLNFMHAKGVLKETLILD
jgi:hypothetical protein